MSELAKYTLVFKVSGLTDAEREVLYGAVTSIEYVLANFSTGASKWLYYHLYNPPSFESTQYVINLNTDQWREFQLIKDTVPWEEVIRYFLLYQTN